ncbi:MAG: DUF6603 domain-containing protein [Acetobacteraceae bacterium]
MASGDDGQRSGELAKQGEQPTKLMLDLKGRFGDYPCTIEAAIGGAEDVSFVGKVDVREGLAGFLRKTLSPAAKDAPFPDFGLQSLELSYKGGGALLLRVSQFEVQLPAGAPVEKLDLDFAFGRFPGREGAGDASAAWQYVAGIRAFTREPIRFAKIGDSKLIEKLLGDFGVSHLGLYYASADVTEGLALFDGKEQKRAFAKGVSFTARFGTPQSSTTIALPPPPAPTGVGGRTLAAPGESSAPRVEPETGGDDKRLRKWFAVQQTFGPLEIRRIGGEWYEGKLGFLLDAGVEMLGLKVALAGFRISVAPAKLTKLTIQDLELGLDGLEIGFKGGPIAISGAFLKIGNEYSGTARISAPMFTIAAIGSYATTGQGDPSLYIFGAYVGVIGGPPCFVVQGIAAGFGYNRGLAVPEIEKVRDFPLVSLVLSPPPSGSTSMLDTLRGNHFPVMQGQYWLAAGIKFTSFKLIDAFALLTVQFGARFELALLGVASMQQPPKVEAVPEPPRPFVFVELALSVRFAPDDGLFAARAVLTSNSYLFDTRCKLTGGFAFCIWFTPTNPAFKNHAGDFVLTFGGYHPRFKMPPHYPQVPRIGFNWQLPDVGVEIKGECYFALTPSCIMGGCRLLATYRSGDLSVWFEAYADFLMAWEPFHYEADIGIWIGASYTLRLGELSTTLSFQLGASLSIWGPEFAGVVRIDLGIISFTVPIGAANQPRTPKPLEWPEFSGKFIPQIDKKPAPLSIAITGGILSEDKERDVMVVNPYELSLLVDAYVPVTTLMIGEKPLDQGKQQLATSFGIRPMGLRAIVSELVVTFVGPGGKAVAMRTRALTKGVPEALWSQEPAPDPSGTQPITAKVISDALSGVRLSVLEARKPKEAAISPKVDAIAKQTAQPGLERPPHAGPVDRTTAEQRLREMLSKNAAARTKTVQALERLGFPLSATAIDLGEMARCAGQTDVLLAPPAFVALGELPPQRQGV